MDLPCPSIRTVLDGVSRTYRKSIDSMYAHLHSEFFFLPQMIFVLISQILVPNDFLLDLVNCSPGTSGSGSIFLIMGTDCYGS